MGDKNIKYEVENLILCDYAMVDQFTNKPSLVGLFNFVSLPDSKEVPISFYVVVIVKGPIGDANIEITLEGSKGIFREKVKGFFSIASSGRSNYFAQFNAVFKKQEDIFAEVRINGDFILRKENVISIKES